MERIEEFTQQGKKFMYIDFSGLNTDDEAKAVISKVRGAMAKYEKNSIYTITNLMNFKPDIRTKEFFTKYTEENAPYVRFGAVLGIDGVKKMMASMVFRLSGRKNLVLVPTKEEAVEFLLKQD